MTYEDYVRTKIFTRGHERHRRLRVDAIVPKRAVNYTR